jgi:hypothetical protein
MLMALALVLTMAAWGMVWAQDGLYVISTAKGKYAPVPKTGQTVSYATGDDGNLQKGVAWPTPRFTDHGNGTVTDNLTGLIWMKNASNVDGALGFGLLTWTEALDAAATLANGTHGLSDGSKAGDWRLPNIRELQSLVDYGHGGGPEDIALPPGHPFIGAQWQSPYWSSTSENAGTPDLAWFVGFDLGVVNIQEKSNTFRIWCVRGGK